MAKLDVKLGFPPPPPEKKGAWQNNLLKNQDLLNFDPLSFILIPYLSF